MLNRSENRFSRERLRVDIIEGVHNIAASEDTRLSRSSHEAFTLKNMEQQQ